MEAVLSCKGGRPFCCVLLAFGGGGGRQSLLWDPRAPPPHLALLVQNMVNEGNVVLLFFAALKIYIYM